MRSEGKGSQKHIDEKRNLLVSWTVPAPMSVKSLTCTSNTRSLHHSHCTTYSPHLPSGRPGYLFSILHVTVFENFFAIRIAFEKYFRGCERTRTVKKLPQELVPSLRWVGSGTSFFPERVFICKGTAFENFRMRSRVKLFHRDHFFVENPPRTAKKIRKQIWKVPWSDGLQERVP